MDTLHRNHPDAANTADECDRERVRLVNALLDAEIHRDDIRAELARLVSEARVADEAIRTARRRLAYHDFIADVEATFGPDAVASVRAHSRAA